MSITNGHDQRALGHQSGSRSHHTKRHETTGRRGIQSLGAATNPEPGIVIRSPLLLTRIILVTRLVNRSQTLLPSSTGRRQATRRRALAFLPSHAVLPTINLQVRHRKEGREGSPRWLQRMHACRLGWTINRTHALSLSADSCLATAAQPPSHHY